MRTFSNKQIKQEYRGEQTAIISFAENEELYELFLCPTSSEEFRQRTKNTYLIERIYAGISPEAGKTIARDKERLNKGLTTLNNLDALLTTHNS